LTATAERSGEKGGRGASVFCREVEGRETWGWHLGGRAGGREPAHEQAQPIVGRGLRVRGGGGHGAFVRLNCLTQVVNRMLAPLEGENAEEQREGEGARRARTPGGGGAENDHGSQKGQPVDAGGDGRRHVVRDRRRRRADRLRRRGDGGDRRDDGRRQVDGRALVRADGCRRENH